MSDTQTKTAAYGGFDNVIFQEDGWERPLSTWFRMCCMMGMKEPPVRHTKNYVKAILNDEEWAIHWYFTYRIKKED